jgi:hypothetical protein
MNATPKGPRQKRSLRPGREPKPPRQKRQRAPTRQPGEERQHPSAGKLILAVALIVALDILLFFAVGYGVGKAIL